jgi:predicted permease
MSIIRRISNLFSRTKVEQEIDAELRVHLEMRAEDNVAAGMSADEARRDAMQRFGNPVAMKEKVASADVALGLASFWADLRYAVRQLRRSMGFTITAFLTIALAIGAVTAVFSVVNGVLLQPYAFHDPGQIVVWRESVREMQQVAPILPDNYRHYLNLKAHANSIQDAAIVQTAAFSVSTGVDHPRITEGLAISPNFFSVLGVTPLLGRAFLPAEAQIGRDKEIILTWAAWQRLYRGDPSVLGKTLRVGGEAQTIVGVLPKGFRFPVMSVMPGQASFGSTERYELFKPLAPQQEELTANDSEFNYVVIARLKPGVSVTQAQSELDGIEKAAAAADHLAIHLGVVVEPFSQEITGTVSRPLWLLLAAVVGVLLMACVNLANLQIARGVAREHETALRSALGAGRARLLQSVLVENLILGLGGGLGGAVLAFFGVRLLTRIAANLPRLNEVHLSAPMLVFALVLSVLTSLGFGILPALRSLRVAPQSALQSSSTRLSGTLQAVRTRRLLVAVEVACSVILLVVTGLITRSFSHLLTQDREFNSEHVVMAKADLSDARYSSGEGMPDDPGADRGSLARDAMIDRTLDGLRSLPGVQTAAVTSVMPLTGDMSVDGLTRPDHPVPEGQVPMANRRFISPGYFETMKIPLLVGREFNAADRQNPLVVIVSDKAAKAAWPEGDALGHTISHWGRVYTVVGIAADARINDLKRDTAVFYLPHWVFPPNNPVFLVRSSAAADRLGPLMRGKIWSVDPEVAVPTLISLDEQLDESVATEKFQAVILSSFGGAALLLAVLGIYGVLSYSVSLRKQEFGIRVALGSSKAALARLVLRDATYPVLGGLVLGLTGAAAATHWIRSMLYETSTIDPWAIGLSVALLILAAFVATLLPARNATSVDPVLVLRGE